MRAGFSLWIKNENNERIFGHGPYELLNLIDEHGSLNRAAKEMNISYTKARNILIKAEKELGLELLTRKIGGASGGGSKLTDEARTMMRKYQKYSKESKIAIEKIFKEIYE